MGGPNGVRVVAAQEPRSHQEPTFIPTKPMGEKANARSVHTHAMMAGPHVRHSLPATGTSFTANMYAAAWEMPSRS